jgi:hypothetical protein
LRTAEAGLEEIIRRAMTTAKIPIKAARTAAVRKRVERAKTLCNAPPPNAATP